MRLRANAEPASARKPEIEEIAPTAANGSEV